ncbi:MAG: glycosyltransferase [Oscillospiraceae bacterium]|jgi:predicted phosphohydrolase|nr:glycosyltransferase [Oscillospiraceae bacterium]
MAIFTLGDTHLSFGSKKPMDIFPGWEGHAARIETHWRRLVRDGDTVVIPGDVSWAMNLSDALEDFRFLHSLPGTKILMKGNHDYWFSTRKKIEDFWESNGFTSLKLLQNNAIAAEAAAICGSRGWFFDSGESADEKVLAREAERLRMSIREARKLSDRVLVFLHYPPLTLDKVCEPLYNILVEEGVTDCWYCHLHGKTAHRRAFQGVRDGIRFRLVSADYLGFCPALVPPESGRLLPPVVSVILPFYNNESTLKRAIDAVAAQTFTRWELLLINDCGSDKSAKAAAKAAAKDSRIHIYNRMENGGPAAARNTGIDAAQGEYIAFLDADDTYLPQYLETALCGIGDADCIRMGFQWIADGADPPPAAPEVPPVACEPLTPEALSEYAAALQTNGFFRYHWRVMLRRTFVQAKGLRFPEGMPYGEDSIFLLDAFFQACAAVNCPAGLYCYYENTTGLTHTFWERPEALALISSHVAAKQDRIIRYVQEPYKTAALENLADYVCTTVLPSLLIAAALHKDKTQRVRAILKCPMAKQAYKRRHGKPSRSMDTLAVWLAQHKLYTAAAVCVRHLWR